MSFINKQDTNGTKGLLVKGELGYDDYEIGGDSGRVYVGTGTENIPLAKKEELNAKANLSGGNAFIGTQTIDGNLEVAGALTISETIWSNQDGVEYFDAGLLGVPDATFSSTGARLYPDGVIRGKSSYGEYVKYPDGRLKITLKQSHSSAFTIAIGGLYIMDTALVITMPILLVSFRSGSNSANNGAGGTMTTLAGTKIFISGGTVQLYYTTGAILGNNTFEALATIEGTWK